MPIEVCFVRSPRAHRGALLSGGTAGFQIHGASFIRQRRIVLDQHLRNDPDFDRILTHELLHFAWVRLGNRRRAGYEAVIDHEIRTGAPGELGWSAESRKSMLRPADIGRRTRKWREYVCESFCDTGAWLFGNLPRCDEYTLAGDYRKLRREWFRSERLHLRISV